MWTASCNLSGRIRFSMALFLGMIASFSVQASHSKTDLLNMLDSAEVLRYKSQLEQAINLCNDVKDAAAAEDYWSIVALSMAELGEVYRFSRDNEKALYWLDSCKEVADKHLGTAGSAHARYNIYRGRLYLSMHGAGDSTVVDRIISHYSVAEQILSNKKYPSEAAMLYYELGRIHDIIGMTEKANTYFKMLLNLIDEQFNELAYLRARYYYFVSIFYREYGDYQRALLLANTADYIFQNGKYTHSLYSVYSKLVVAQTYYLSGDYIRSIAHYDNIISLAERGGYFSQSFLLHIYVDRLISLYELKHFDEVISQGWELIEMNAKSSAYDSTILYSTYTTLAETYNLTGNGKLAEVCFKKSMDLRISLHGADHEKVYLGYIYSADSYFKKGANEKALAYYQRALNTLFADFESQSVYQNPDFSTYERKEYILYIVFPKAVCLYQQYKIDNSSEGLKASFELFRTGHNMLNEFLNSGLLDQSILRKFKDFESSLDLSIECAFDLYKSTGNLYYVEDALQFIENNKYFLLERALVSTRQRYKGEYADSINLKQKRLKMEVIHARNQLESIDNEDSAFQLRNLLIQKHNLISGIQGSFTDLRIDNKVRVSDNTSLSLKAVQSLLDESGEIIVEYSFAKNKIYAVVIGADLLDFVEILATETLQENIATYLMHVSGKNATGASEKEAFIAYVTSSIFLYKSLIEPILDKVRVQEPKIERMIIIPDGSLSYLPFESLLTSISDASSVNYWNLPYLCKEYTINYGYSLKILENNLRSKKNIQMPEVLGFSYSDSQHSNVDRISNLSDIELKFSSEELDRIGQRINRSHFYKGDNASEHAFKSNARDFSLLHLALHGVVDTTDMFDANLRFKNGGSTHEDGILYAYELYDLDLSNTELAVLSACETGLGQHVEGEGIFSIARGFAYAGCPAIVMSLWKVDDKATAELMDQFYGFLSEGLYKDEALRRAKLHYIENANDLGAHPANWAAFIPLGNYEPIQLQKVIADWVYLILSIILICLVLFLLYRKWTVRFLKLRS